ncbi:acyl-CoA thioesterase [Neobacillus niacini]|uniref:acyl-CoA thioesterase n=1 Tax=Neobacillus niacini TaxID=86668 RepID=UPI002FFEAAFD
MKTEYPIIVGVKDIDDLDHLNNSRSIVYLQHARTNWYENLGLPVEEMMNRNVGTVVVKLEVNYFKEARLNERLTVHTSPLRIGNKSFVLKQVISNEEGKIITESTVTLVTVDLITRKSILVVEEIVSKFENY